MSILEARQISKRFGGLMAVRDFSLAVQPGEIVALIGPNGAGKTTCFNLLSGFYVPDSGDVLLEGNRINGKKAYTICRLGLGRTFQVVKPFRNLSVLDNVLVGAFARTSDRRQATRIAEEVLEFTGMAQLKNQLAGDLTIGYKKRLEVCRALATGPKVLLLDEVMAGLNPREVDGVVDLIKQMRRERGITIVFVEHVMRAVMALADRIVVLHHGEKIAEGSPREVAADPRVIEAYLGEEHTHVAG